MRDVSMMLAAAAFTLVYGASANDAAQATETFEYSKVPNRSISVGSVRYAYRKVGEDNGVPLILLMHTRGNMDYWDPALVDELAKLRLVIAFDNKGVGLTSGKAPESFEEMADDAVAFVKALGYQKVDILGFSIGGAVGQEFVLRHPVLVRKAILAGTSGKGGEGVNSMDERSKAASTKAVFTDDDELYGFFAQCDQPDSWPSIFDPSQGPQHRSRRCGLHGNRQSPSCCEKSMGKPPRRLRRFVKKSHDSRSDRERQGRYPNADCQFIPSIQCCAEGPTHSLSGRRPRIFVSIPEMVR
jgi:pimeloyl-ACP methyl ester carboxylesterase